MAPEQARGDTPVDERMDIYALGAILYECLTNRRVHPGNEHNDIIYHVLTQRPEPLPSSFHFIQEVVNKSLASDVANRFRTVDHFLRALRGACRGRFDSAAVTIS